MFSIIIPLYNKTTYIEKAIRSVLNQTYHEFELIIVDDGSTDNGVLVVEQYLQKQLKEGNNSLSDNVRIVRQANAGVSTARNNGVELAKYDYIAFLDADDWWEPNFLQEMKALIEAFPEAGIYSSNYYLVKNSKSKIAPIKFEKKFDRGIIDYFNIYAKNLCMPIWTGTAIIKKEIFDSEHGFNPNITLGEDTELWIRVALTHKVAFLNYPLANYNQDAEQNNRAIGKLHNLKNHILFNLDYLKDEEKRNHYLKQMLDNLRTYDLFKYYLKAKYRDVVLRELEKVNWELQSKTIRRKYRMPLLLIQAETLFIIIGSKLKKRIIVLFQYLQLYINK